MDRRQLFRFRLAVVVSVLAVLAGLWLALGQDTDEVAPLGWTFVVIGALGLVVNLALCDRIP